MLLGLTVVLAISIMKLIRKKFTIILFKLFLLNNLINFQSY